MMIRETVPDSEFLNEPVCNTCSWDDISKSYSFGGLSVFSMNIRSMQNKFTEFKAHIAYSKVKFTFIILTEIWLNNHNDYVYDIEGYQCFTLYRDASKGGGIKIYCSKDIPVISIDHLTTINNHCEQLFVKAFIAGMGNIVVGAIYRPPQNNVNDFCLHLDAMLSSLADKKCIITGDINVNILNKNIDRSVANYIETYTQYGFSNEINLPTYVSPITNTALSCLDHMITNINLTKKSIVIKPNISDHYPICMFFTKNINLPCKKVTFRDFSESNVLKFREHVEREFRAYMPTSDDPNEQALYLTNFSLRILNKYFPIKSKNLSFKRFKAPWITSKILKCIAKNTDGIE